MLIPQEMLINTETKTDRYNSATLAATAGILTRPAQFPVLLGVSAYGATLYRVDIKGDGGALGDSCGIAGYDMAPETNELTPQNRYHLINETFAVGEKIDVLGTSLTLGAEASIYAIWGKSKLPLPSLRYAVRTYTNTTDNESLEGLPRNATTLRSIYCAGVDLEATEFKVGGESRPGWVQGRQCSALNDIIMPPEYWACYVRNVGGATFGTGLHNHGTGGASIVHAGYEWK